MTEITLKAFAIPCRISDEKEKEKKSWNGSNLNLLPEVRAIPSSVAISFVKRSCWSCD